MTKGVLFDLFGTLVFLRNISNPSPFTCLYRVLGLRGEKVDDARNNLMTRNFNHIGELADLMRPMHGIDTMPYHRKLLEEYGSMEMYDDAEEVILEAKGKGYKVGIVSNAPTYCKVPFSALSIAAIVDHVVLSCDAGIAKPDVRIFKKAIEDMHIDPSTSWMVGDSFGGDILAGKNAGLNGILVDAENEFEYQPKVRSLREVLRYI